MKNTEFDSLDSKELKEGFLKCGDSAFMHFDAAELLARNSFYQLGCAHLILGAEESIKAIVFFSKLREFLKVEFNPKYFYEHHPKHITLKELSGILQEILKLMFSISNQNDKMPGWMKDENQRLLQDHLKIDKKIVDHWWENANSIKNRAFYVSRRKTQWESPDSITEADYERGEKVLRGLRDFLKVIHKVESENDIE